MWEISLLFYANMYAGRSFHLAYFLACIIGTRHVYEHSMIPCQIHTLVSTSNQESRSSASHRLLFGIERRLLLANLMQLLPRKAGLSRLTHYPCLITLRSPCLTALKWLKKTSSGMP